VPEIKNALQNNLCRCGTHLRIVRAVKRASEA
jgi:nicotinate dehydrogenase subunit A